MGSAWSQTVQKDQRQIVESGSIAAAPESVLSMPGSIAIEAGHGVSQTFIQEFTPEMGAALESIAESNDQTMARLLGFAEEVMSGLLTERSEEQLGEASAVIKYLPYAILGLLAIAIFAKTNW